MTSIAKILFDRFGNYSWLVSESIDANSEKISICCLGVESGTSCAETRISITRVYIIKNVGITFYRKIAYCVLVLMNSHDGKRQ